jgi:phospholipid-translocating ATPase
MIFRQCSVGGSVYKGDPEPEKPVLEKRASNASGSDVTASGAAARAEHKEASVPSLLPAPTNPETKFHDSALLKDIDLAVNAEPGTEDAAHARLLNGFFTVLSLCHTVLTSVDAETGALKYKAQSPDEEALVQAAADVGYIFRGRDRDVLRLQTPFSDELETYQLLNILEFSSARKRMSVIVKRLDDNDERLFLLSKGADNVIFERLKPGVAEDLKRVTEEHLDQFASEGLRTLTLAYKVVPRECCPLYPRSLCRLT